MTISQQTAFSNLLSIGFTARQAEFLYLVGTHTGVFTAEHYRRYAGASRGKAQVSFLDKLDALGYIRRVDIARLQILQIKHKAFYQAILTPDSRLRRSMSLSLMRQRLQYLDYIVTNSEQDYLGPEAAKVEFFIDRLHLPDSILPQETWKSTQSEDTTTRHFPERYPIFASEADGVLRTGIVYGEDPVGKFRAFRSFLQSNRAFLSRLPYLQLVYVSPSSRRREMAQAAVTALFSSTSSVMTDDLARYFALRSQIENNTASHFTRDDYAFWSYARKQYNGPEYERQYLESQGQLSLPVVSSARRISSVVVQCFVPFTALHTTG